MRGLSSVWVSSRSCAYTFRTRALESTVNNEVDFGQGKKHSCRLKCITPVCIEVEKRALCAPMYRSLLTHVDSSQHTNAKNRTNALCTLGESSLNSVEHYCILEGPSFAARCERYTLDPIHTCRLRFIVDKNVFVFFVPPCCAQGPVLHKSYTVILCTARMCNRSSPRRQFYKRTFGYEKGERGFAMLLFAKDCY